MKILYRYERRSLFRYLISFDYYRGRPIGNRSIIRRYIIFLSTSIQIFNKAFAKTLFGYLQMVKKAIRGYSITVWYGVVGIRRASGFSVAHTRQESCRKHEAKVIGRLKK